MSVPSIALPETPLDRLNYYNSQRLEAVDFRLEQQYHMRIRRSLNKALYSPGIAEGLEVRRDPVDRHSVVISPGLALDTLGREVILIEELRLRVRGQPRRPDGVQFGNYLVISYDEEKVAPQRDGCQVSLGSPSATGTAGGCGCGSGGGAKKSSGDCGCGGGGSSSRGGGCGCGGSGSRGGSGGCGCGGGASAGSPTSELSWGAPSRIRSTPRVLMQDAWPSEAQGKILLAQIVLNDTCQVEDVKSGMRRYVSATKPPNAAPISIEGEKDIDKDNPKILRFHVEGGFPDNAVLYLQGFKFSSLYYTELGKHNHAFSGAISEVTQDFVHKHTATAATTDSGGDHSHSLWLDTTEGDVNGVDCQSHDDCNWNGNVISGVGGHTHGIQGLSLQDALGPMKHSHQITNAAVGDGGVTDVSARAGVGTKALTHFNGLRVFFDGGLEITGDILAQLQAINQTAWDKLGDGNQTHEFVQSGTGRIDLRQLGLDLSPGMHWLTFAVDAGGGQLHYNLYVS